MKILRAAGEHGKHDQFRPCEFNWCNVLEPVGLHGMVCCNSASCGCNRAFNGIQSAKSATKAVVTEVSEAEFEALCDTLYNSVLTGWSVKGREELAKKIAQKAVVNFRQIPANIEQFAPGTVLRVKRKVDRNEDTETIELEIIA